MTEDLAVRVGAIVDRARERATGPDAVELEAVRARLDGPLRVAIAGKVKAGKSTLLNAILGEELAATDAGECTQIVTWYVHGTSPRVVLHPVTGDPMDTPYRRDGGPLDIDLRGLDPASVARLEVEWPTSRLSDLTLLDTPGIASISAEVSQRTQRVLNPDDGRVPVADAVIYLLRHAHASDIRFLEAFHDDDLAHGTPMNAVGVLARADEIGSCRLDALEVADRVSRRYEHDVRLRRLCPVVVPVDGLLAYAASTLREVEYAMLARVAAAPEDEIGALLLTVDRFRYRDTGVDLTEVERGHLLERLGLFGLRLSVELIRTGAAPTATALAEQLGERSGLPRLRSVLTRQFGERARVLKARSAIVALQAVLARGAVPQSPEIEVALEQLQSSAHEFQEVRLLSDLRGGELGLSDQDARELDRLLGGSGHDAWSRLGLSEDVDPEAVRTAAFEAVQRWHRRGSHPLSGRPLQLAAAAAIRSVEGIIAGLGEAGSRG